MPKKTNVVLIFSDQHRACDVGCYGNSQVKTPNLDKMAENGVVFTNAVSNCPVCTPARGSLLTGYQPLTHKAIANDLPIDKDVHSIATTFGKAGYKTGYIGKWHLDGVPRSKFTTKDRRLGFEFWAAYNCHHEYFDTKYYMEEDKLIKVKGYEPEIQTDLALNFIRENKDSPFLLTISYGPPHSPYQLAPERFKKIYNIKDIRVRDNFECLSCHPGMLKHDLGKSNDKEVTIGDKLESIAGYWALVTSIDHCIGRIREEIKKLGLYKDTILIYTSDHGDMLYSHGWERKQIAYSESVGVPLIFEWGYKLPKEYKNSKTVFSLVDITPTLYGLVGIDKPIDIEGKDLSLDLFGKKITQNDVLIMDIVSLDEAYWQERRYYEWRGIKTDEYTYVKTLKKGSFLFNDIKDPFQLNNLVSNPKYKELYHILDRKLVEKLKETKDDFLPWQEQVKKSGLVNLWNERCKEINKISGGLCSPTI